MITKEKEDNSKVNYQYTLNNEVVGNILIEETIDVINIVDVFVKEEERRKGIAFTLMNEVIKDYKGKKEKIMLEVRKSNEAAINLYNKCGFKEIFIRKNYYKDEDAIIMEVLL